MSANPAQQFWRSHFYYPFALFLAAVLIIEFCGVDMLLADFFYRLEGGSWVLRNAWITSKVIHIGGRNLSILLSLLLIIVLICSYFSSRLKAWRREFIYLLCAAGGSSAVIAIIKSQNHASCAWDFSRYGGTREYATVFTEFVKGAGNDCFPAGHASAGYAWIALYFIGVHLHSRWRWAGLLIPAATGLVFGISQQLRGAHFISHDVWTLGICWFFSLMLYRIMLVDKKISA